MNSELCECTPCNLCNGKGGYYVDMGGRFVGFTRIDDLHDFEPCEECGGSGKDSYCPKCSEDLIDADSEEYRR